MTIDTIAELFSGIKALFEGLYAEKHWDWEQMYPVIRLSFADGFEQGNVGELRMSIRDSIVDNASRLGIVLDQSN